MKKYYKIAIFLRFNYYYNFVYIYIYVYIFRWMYKKQRKMKKCEFSEEKQVLSPESNA